MCNWLLIPPTRDRTYFSDIEIEIDNVTTFPTNIHKYVMSTSFKSPFMYHLLTFASDIIINAHTQECWSDLNPTNGQKSCPTETSPDKAKL